MHTWGWWRRNASRLKMRSVPLRRWLVLCLALLILLPLLTGTITAVIINIGNHDEGQSPTSVLAETSARWRDPAWQASAAAELQNQGIEFILLEQGVEIYRSTDNPHEGNDYPGGVRQLDFGDQRSALIYGDQWGPSGDDDWPVPVVAIGTLIATFVGMGVFFGRSVVKPLAATSSAAEEIAGGNLRIALPGSRVREVAELNAAFGGMASALSESLSHEAELEQERRLFIGAVAHDLRTPLFALRGSLEAIRTGVADTEEKRQRYLTTAEEKAAALDRLVSDLFDFTRLEFLEQTPRREAVPFGALVRRCVDALQPQAVQKEIVLTFDDRTGGAVVLGDAHMLTRAIDNLVDNAIRFTPAGGQARVECLRDRDTLVLSVADTGPGIPPDDLPHIFQPLYRGESSRNRRTGGAGLGLTIARNVFTAHGGDLTARNGPSGGAIFIATAPISAEQPAASNP
jgi:signal transduction histidine kinase